MQIRSARMGCGSLWSIESSARWRWTRVPRVSRENEWDVGAVVDGGVADGFEEVGLAGAGWGRQT